MRERKLEEKELSKHRDCQRLVQGQGGQGRKEFNSSKISRNYRLCQVSFSQVTIKSMVLLSWLVSPCDDILETSISYSTTFFTAMCRWQLQRTFSKHLFCARYCSKCAIYFILKQLSKVGIIPILRMRKLSYDTNLGNLPTFFTHFIMWMS